MIPTRTVFIILTCSIDRPTPFSVRTQEIYLSYFPLCALASSRLCVNSFDLFGKALQYIKQPHKLRQHQARRAPHALPANRKMMNRERQPPPLDHMPPAPP